MSYTFSRPAVVLKFQVADVLGLEVLIRHLVKVIAVNSYFDCAAVTQVRPIFGNSWRGRRSSRWFAACRGKRRTSGREGDDRTRCQEWSDIIHRNSKVEVLTRCQLEGCYSNYLSMCVQQNPAA